MPESAFRHNLIIGTGASQTLFPKNARRRRLVLTVDTTNTFWFLAFGQPAVANAGLLLLGTGMARMTFDVDDGDVFITEEVNVLANAAAFIAAGIEVVEL